MHDPIARQTDRKIAKLQERIEEVYKEARSDVENKIQEFSKKFEVKDKIYRKKLEDGKITKEQYVSWVKGQAFQSEQWKSKRDQIINTIMDSNRIATAIISGETADVFKSNANYMAYTLEHGVGVNFGFGLYDNTTIVKLIKDDPDLLPKWKIDEPKNYIWSRKKVNSAVTQGIIQGESLDKIVKRISNGLVSNNKNLMKTFARTAMTEAQNSGRNTRLQEAKGKGINVLKEWMATLDGRTRDSHAAIDGEKVPVGDKWHPYKFSNGCEYPGDPKGPAREVYNCRCTLVGDVSDYPSEYARYDNIDGKPIKNMTYAEWTKAKKSGTIQPYDRPLTVPAINSFQSKLGSAVTIDEINDLMNAQQWFKNGTVNLTGCDVESAKSIAASYEQMYKKYPALKGKFTAPNAQPAGMKENTYAWCRLRSGQVQVNPQMYSDWEKISRSYERDVKQGWHPYGTTAESIIIHELGHAVDGLLAREGILGGVTASGEYRYASSSLKMTILNRVAKQDPQFAADLKMYDGVSFVVLNEVSEYATQNNKEWFAECFAEYITSASPRRVAQEFGKELEKLLGRLE